MDDRLVSRASTRHAEPVTLRPTISVPVPRCYAVMPPTSRWAPPPARSSTTGRDSGPFLRLLNGVRDVDQLRRLARTDVPELGIVPLDPPDPDLLLVVSCGEPPRAVFDQARRHRISHLPVVIDEERVRIGPVVIPGLTPCLTCLDLHITHAG